MHAQRPQRIPRRLDSLNTLIPPQIPELDFAIAARGHEFALPSALQMNVREPGAVLFPDADHGGLGFLALVVEAHGAVAETCDEEVAFYLVGS